MGVFQAPQPVRPRANGSAGLDDNSLDIDSPFLDLFGGAPASAPAAPASEGEQQDPPGDDDDFDFGFEFEERTPAGAPALSVLDPDTFVLDTDPAPDSDRAAAFPDPDPGLGRAAADPDPGLAAVGPDPAPRAPDRPPVGFDRPLDHVRDSHDRDRGLDLHRVPVDLGQAPSGHNVAPPDRDRAPSDLGTATTVEQPAARDDDAPRASQDGPLREYGSPAAQPVHDVRPAQATPATPPHQAPPVDDFDAGLEDWPDEVLGAPDRPVSATPPSAAPLSAPRPVSTPPGSRPVSAAPASVPPASAPPVSAARPVSAPPVSTPPLWQTVATPDRSHSANGGHPGVTPVPRAPERDIQPIRSGRALAEPEPRDLPATMPERAPARPQTKAPAKRRRKRDEPDNLPAVRKSDLKPATVKPGKIKFSDRDPSIELEISEIAGHLTFTQSTVTAWYWLPEVRWAFRPDAEREALLSAISEQYAGLAGFRLHLRRTTRPFPADEWARTVDSLTVRPLPDVSGATSWSDHLVAAQRHLLSVNHAEGQTYLGVTFARRSLGDTFSERILRMFGKGTSDGERRKLGRTVEQFDEVLNAFGMRGRRVTPQELEWLLFRSVALCMAPPGPLSPVTSGQWDSGDLLALTEQVERYRTPYGSTVKLVNRMTGEERHVAVLSVGRMEPLEIPEKHEPWMHFHERLPWPMELSSRIDILGSGSSFKNLEHRLRMIRSQQLDYAEHGIDAPPELERLAKRALVIGDEMTTGLPVESARAHGWHRIAVGGRTREECLERARRLIQLYSRELRISLQHPKNQDQLAREFIPGEPIANTGYVRRMPVKLLAAALPQAASTVGDRRGDLIGRTAGTCRRPVFLDLHFPMEVRERSGLGVFVAEPGGGKSTLMGALGYLNARRGVQVTLLDPSGPLARLCQMPELKPYSRVLNLTGSEQGTLAPYALIPTPIRTEFPAGPGGDREYEIAVSNARAERRMLVQDICSMLVPPQVAKEASTATLLRHAVRKVPAEETSTLDDVVRTLQGLDDDGKELANLLLDTAEMPLALLFFGSPPKHLLGADSTLTVITMAGLRLPDLKIEREYWSAEESLALPMLHTAHRLAVRRSYGGSMSARKMVGLDEAHFMEGWRSGRSFLVRLARDSRKWNLAALIASQNPRDILGLDVQNLVSTVFVGRIAEDQEIASEALRLLRVPVHDGYESTLASLSQVDTSSSHRLGFREFVMRDVDGRVQKVRVDVSYVDGLLEHLDTTPAAQAAPVTTIPSMSDLEG
ncbi:ATP-binding protein [Actinoplanes sp. NBRC 103695]|uniref:ATP-binding protein n=1 Tax=Actinoplanes sp. NBRC 103695 TaxID=3032202 RepID=UPI002554C065|nr:ATP-binding protein [Actinoplanes sp. NBRC 103695]